MKNLFKLFVPVAAAVIATTACNQEAFIRDAAPAMHITVKATPDAVKTEAPASKTYIDGTRILWGTGEYMLIGVNDGSATAWGTSSDESADVWEGLDQAFFTFNVSPVTASGEYTYYGLYPAAAAVETEKPTEYKVILPAQQNATATSYDPKAYILVARPEGGKTETEADWTAYFRRATALNKITLSNLPEDIKRVIITAPDGVNMAGRRKFNLTTGESGEIYYGQTNSIEVRYSSKLDHSAPMDIWFASWEAEVGVGENLTVSAISDAHVYTRTITPTAKPIQFREGYLSYLSIDMASANVEDNTELAPGNYVIVAKDGNPASYYALKAAESGTRIASEDYTGSIVSYAGDESIVWAVAQVGESYTIANSGKYVGYKGTKNEAYWLAPAEDWTESNYLMDIVWDQTNSCYHVSLHSASDRVLQRNGSSNYFAFYTSVQQKNLLFIPATVDSRTAVTLSFAEAEVNLTSDETVGYYGQTIIVDPDDSEIADNLTWTYTDPDGIVDSFDDASGELTLTGDSGTVTVTASYAGSETYRPADEVSYTIVVTSGSTPVSGWVETALSSISAGDVFVMVGTNSSSATYAMANDGGTSSDPGLVAVTVSSGKLADEPADRIKWNLTGNATDGYTFYPNGQTTRLYCNTVAASSSNSNLRVGDGGSRILFVLNEDNRLVTKDDYVARYIGFNGTNNFRGYINNTGLATFKFYKLVDSRISPDLTWSTTEATAMYDTGNDLSFEAPTLVNPNSVTGITYASTDETIATIDESGEVTIRALVGNTIKEGSTTIKAIFAGDATYSAQTVTYTLSVTDDRDDVATPSFSPAEGEVAENTEVTFLCDTEGVTFYYTVDNSTPTTESASGTSVIIDAAKTVKVIATKEGYKDSAVASATYSVSGEVPNDGSLEHPYTVSEALTIINGYSDKQKSEEKVYVSGIIAAVGSYNETYHSVTYDISDDGNAENTLNIYSGKFVANTPFSSNSQINKGDEVLVYGFLYLYGSTQEMYQENYIYSLNGKTKAITLDTFTAVPDNDKKQITVTWAASGTESTISFAITCGSQNFNATADGSHTFTMADYGEYPVAITATADDAFTATASTTATLTDPSSGTPSPETITFADLGLSNGVQYSDPFDGGNFTIQFAGGGNDGKYYTTGAGIRTYGGGSFTITSSYTISEIAFTWDGSYVPSEDVANPSGYSTSTKKWTGEATSVTLTRPSGSGHWRLKSVKVTYK